MDILAPILTLGSLGILFGLGLSYASKKFCVKHDPKIDQLIEDLPGANCGACGKAGCMAFAEALIKAEETLDKCVVCSEEEKNAVCKILGIEPVKQQVKKTAVLHCNGGKKVKDRFNYSGIETCTAANLILGGQKSCTYGCLGFADCMKICPFDAIEMTEEDLPQVNLEKCRACGKCIDECPKSLFTLTDTKKKVHIRCKSHDMGKAVMTVCRVGCIACRKCANICPVKAIDIVNNLAVINYDKCIVCGKCVKECPTKAIEREERK